MKRVLHVSILLVTLLIPTMMVWAQQEEEWTGLRSGSYYKWKCTLQVLDRAKGTYVFYWTAIHYMKIIGTQKTSDKIDVKVAYATWYVDVNNSRYTREDAEDRIANRAYGSLKRSYRVTKRFYMMSFLNETWGFKMMFPFSPFMVFNPKARGFKMFLERHYTRGYVKGMYMERGVMFETWDLIEGTKRDVYYMEIYYYTLDLNINETAIDESSIMEVNVEIDKELGIVLKLRYFWGFANNMFELVMQIVDTNMFLKHQFTMMVISIIVALIIIGLVVRYYKERRRRRLIRI